jgi:hypothetical protein
MYEHEESLPHGDVHYRANYETSVGSYHQLEDMGDLLQLMEYACGYNFK